MREREFSKRQRQVSEEVRYALARILSHFRPTDRKEEIPITITEVQMSPDLRHAKVFFVSLGRKQDVCKEIASMLNKETPLIQKELTSHVSLRFLPRLRFFEDNAFETAEAIEQTLRKMSPRDEP